MKIPLELPPGLVGDDTDFSTGGWRDGSGVRFWRGKPETIRGWERLSLTALTGVCRTAFSWKDGDNFLTFAFGLHNGLTVWQNGDQASITPVSGFTPGQIDGTGSAGYGTGAYGVGDYGEPSATDYFPLTWSFGTRSFGELYANPRGQGVFKWENNTASPAAVLTNAPAVCTYLMCAFTDQVMAFGCTDTGGLFNASCIRISDSADPTVWTPGTANTAQQYYLSGNARIVGARSIGRYVLVWTESELHLGTYTDSWSFDRIGGGCGLCGPNAAVVVGSKAFWISPDNQFYAYSLGAEPALMICPVRDAFADNAAASQADKIVASSISERGEVAWFYADQRDGTGYEVSRMISVSTVDGAWSMAQLARTAFVDANPAASPVGVTYDGILYWQERGSSADGASLTASLRTGGQYMDPAERVMLLRGIWPDFRDQQGPINLTIFSRFYPQDEPVEHGPFLLMANGQKTDFLVTGRIFDFEFSSESSPMSWRMGKLTFDAETLGER